METKNEICKINQWWDDYTNKKYMGVPYRMYGVTPSKVEKRIKEIVDSQHLEIEQNRILMNIHTEGSTTFIVDIWVNTSYVDKSQMIKDEVNNVLISRQKNPKGKYAYRIRHIISAE